MRGDGVNRGRRAGLVLGLTAALPVGLLAGCARDSYETERIVVRVENYAVDDQDLDGQIWEAEEKLRALEARLAELEELDSMAAMVADSDDIAATRATLSAEGAGPAVAPAVNEER